MGFKIVQHIYYKYLMTYLLAYLDIFLANYWKIYLDKFVAIFSQY